MHGQGLDIRMTKQIHERDLQFSLTLTLTLTGAPPGDYTLTYTLHDVTGPRSVDTVLPFAIAT